jgi:signal transduction histidine kinase
MDEIDMLFLSLKLLEESTRSNLELGQRMKMAALVQLSRGVHHEVRNPLHAISFCAVRNLHYCKQGIYDRMDEKLFDSSLSRGVEMITQDIERIKTTLDRFSQLSKPKANFNLKILNLFDEFEKFLALMREAKRLDHIRVHNDMARDIWVHGNSGVLQEIFFNLFNNAYDAMKGQGALFVQTEVSGSLVSLGFKDTGHGIPEEIRPAIFDEYFTTKENTEAVGIGLSITRQLIERTGGSIRSVPCAGGAQFILNFQRVALPEAA